MIGNKKYYNIIKHISALAFWIIVWETASALVGKNLAIFLPGPFAVIKAFICLLPELSFWSSVCLTLLRIFSGFLCGSVLGIAFGILTSNNKVFDIIISPALSVIRAVPVVSFIILAYLFIDVNYLPVFICSLMVMPLVWQVVHDSIFNFDINLKEMCTVYKVGRIKSLFFVILPSVTDRIITILVSAVGIAWKSGVAAEILCTPEISIGKKIFISKANLDYEKVYALTLVVVVLSLILEFFIKAIWKSRQNKRGGIKNVKVR